MLGLPRLPLLKAWLASLLFGAIGLWTLFAHAPLSSVLLPEAIFFAVLVLNTFYSIRLYAAIQPDDLAQAIVDVILVVTYLWLALSLGTHLTYFLAATILFIVATPKYMLMRGKIPYDALLRRKVKIDTSGIALCALSLALAYFGHSFAAAWLLAIAFAIANAYLLLIRPMYVL